MWVELSNSNIIQQIDDSSPVITQNGIQYPWNFPKTSIPGLSSVVMAIQPDPSQFIVTGYSVVLANGIPTQILDTSPIPLSQIQAAQIALINSSAQTELAAIVTAYPDLEVSTWTQQYTEAHAFTTSNTASTPLLSAISTASNTSVSSLVSGVIAKATAYQAASGAIIGKRIALTAQINAATTAAEVQAIVW